MSALSNEDPEELEATRLALRRLFEVGLAFALIALATYAVPRSERLRPWVAGEGVPIARMFQEEDQALPEFAEATARGGPPQARPSAGESEGADALEPAEPAPGPDGVQPAAGPGLRIEPHEYEGLRQPIEQPKALDAFFAKLTRVAQREPNAIARVAHYGDSAVASDGITSTMRRKLQRRFGDAGHGFVLISRGDMHYNHRDVVHRSSSGWELHSTTVGGLSPGLYGYGGVQARGKGGEQAYFSTVSEGQIGRRVGRFEVFYQRLRGAGPIEIKVDGKRHRVLQTRADKYEDAYEVVTVPDGPHSLTIKAIGAQARLYGVALERDVPGVVYDSLGLVGARADRLLNTEAQHMQRQIARRAPDMLVLAFGGNESANKWLNMPNYERELTQVVKHMRAGRPEMSCLLFAPLDQGERDARGKVVTVPVLPKIIDTQRRVALASGCAFFDAWTAMGGSGSMAAWLKARPKLATSDLRHATPAGYDLIGELYYKALLKAFSDYLAARGRS